MKVRFFVILAWLSTPFNVNKMHLLISLSYWPTNLDPLNLQSGRSLLWHKRFITMCIMVVANTIIDSYFPAYPAKTRYRDSWLIPTKTKRCNHLVYGGYDPVRHEYWHFLPLLTTDISQTRILNKICMKVIFQIRNIESCNLYRLPEGYIEGGTLYGIK